MAILSYSVNRWFLSPRFWWEDKTLLVCQILERAEAPKEKWVTGSLASLCFSSLPHSLSVVLMDCNSLSRDIYHVVLSLLVVFLTPLSSFRKLNFLKVCTPPITLYIQKSNHITISLPPCVLLLLVDEDPEV